MSTDVPVADSRQTDPDDGARRIRPVTNEVTAEIIAEPPAPGAPQVAPDIPRPIDPGPVLGVAREHSDDLAEPPPPLSRADDLRPPRLTPGLVTTVQSVQGYPCVSLLLTTRPGARMDRIDAERLERLRLSAISRLRAEHLSHTEQETIASLDRLVQEAMSGPTDRAVALFANREFARTVNLTVEVEDRAVIDPTFATRDLVRALHRTPRHVVLVLTWHRATLFDGAGGRLTPAAGTRFPMHLQTRHNHPDDREGLLSALRAVDRALGTYLRLHPAPVVVVGPQKAVTSFHSLSHNLSRLAGTVYGKFDDVSVAELARRTRPALNNYLRSREHAALTRVQDRSSTHRVASGIATAWLAARTERPEMLAVEESYRYPARLSADGDLVTPADDVEAPDVIDDLIDELIETVLERGGWIALVRDGSLTEHSKVALTLH
ncbi:MAG TPA: hypothetical protein VES02_00650 [Dermatophilaceae bacterium]|nr:hypothetical protein [Dermatophilaceae bacterium]